MPALLLVLVAQAARAECAHAPGPASALLGDRDGMADFRRVRFVESDDAKAKKEHAPLARTRGRSSDQPSTPCIHCRKGSDRAPMPRVNLLERGDLLSLSTCDRPGTGTGEAFETQPVTYHFLLVNDLTPPPKLR